MVVSNQKEYQKVMSRLLLIALSVMSLSATSEQLQPSQTNADVQLHGEQQPDQQKNSKPFTFEDVRQKALELARHSYQRDDSGMPEFLAGLNYDQYREIRYKPDKALWRDEGLPFQIQAFHRGFIFKDRVTINVIDHGLSTRMAYSPELFDYGKNQLSSTLPSDLGFAGLRIHNALRKDAILDEVAVFLGASYFRAIGLGQVYGISSRGLAIDTGLPKAEEFPIFKEFWIVKPEKEDTNLIVYALLDSSNVTGAYQFNIGPGLDTTITVNCRLFLRGTVTRIGIAPLTSMYLHGENTDRFIDDFRPEVHDSDGFLLGRNTGEWVWRPLNNPRQLRISVFSEKDPVGFGLVARDRDFDHFQDLEAQYHRRPSVWVETLGSWGSGAVYLIEIPSDAEKYDNIVAYWSPNQALSENKELSYDYRLHFVLDEPPAHAIGKVQSTRIGSVGGGSRRKQFVIDFASPTIRRLSAKAKIDAEISSSAGRIYNPVVHKNEETGAWRLSFELDHESEKDLIELRGLLKSGKDILTETWVYQWNVR